VATTAEKRTKATKEIQNTESALLYTLVETSRAAVIGHGKGPG